MQVEYSHSIELRVRYSETDQMGYCYYGNYAQYFEVGRVEALREIGLSYKEMEDSGIMLPVSAFNVNYLNPALYDDLLLITTKIEALNGCRLLFSYEIKKGEKIKIATAQTTLVFVSKTSMKPISPPTSFLTILKKYEK